MFLAQYSFQFKLTETFFEKFTINTIIFIFTNRNPNEFMKILTEKIKNFVKNVKTKVKSKKRLRASYLKSFTVNI